jgi:hypothetical protein
VITVHGDIYFITGVKIAPISAPLTSGWYSFTISDQNSIMKKLFFIAALMINCWFTATAQLHISLNIGSQPAWGPTGYDHADYYYIPDADMYYDVNNRVYIYREGREWRRVSYLPPRYRNIDLYHVHKVVINNDRDPWNHHDRYYNQYSGYRGRHDQQVIRDAREERYWQNPGNRNYGQWRRDHNPGRGHDDHDNGNHYGHDNDHGRGHDDDHGRGYGDDHGRGHGEDHGHGHGRGH